MPLTLVTVPAAEPVTRAEAKLFARIPSAQTDDDDLLDGLIGAAREYVEGVTGRQLIVATWKLTLRAFPCFTYANPCALIFVPRPPLVSVDSVKYRNTDGTLVTLTADTDYLVDTAAQPGTIEPVTAWPATGEFPDAIQIQFTAGYAASDASPTDPADNVPSRAKVAIKSLVAHWFENREPVADARTAEVPLHVSRLLRSLRIKDV